MIDLETTSRQFLRVEEVMELLTVSKRTVYYWVEHHAIEHMKIRGTVRISVKDLRRRLHQITRHDIGPVYDHLRSVQNAQRLF